jgi:ribonuclease J
VIIVVARSTQDGSIVGDPEVVFRGFVHAGDLERLTEEAKRRVIEALEAEEMTEATDIVLVKNRVHDVLQKYLHKEAGRRPMVLPVVVEV